MSPEDVPAELVERAKPALRDLLATEGVFPPADHPRFEFVARRILTAILKDDMARPELRPWKPNLGFWLRHPLVSWRWHRQAKGARR